MRVAALWEFGKYSFFSVIQLPDGEIQRGVVGFAPTQIKKYKLVTTRLTGLVGSPAKFPIFAFQWRMTTVPEQNKKGKFHGWRWTLAGNTPDESRLAPNSQLYQTAREFNRILREGGAKVDYNHAAQDGAEADEEIPCYPLRKTIA